MKNERLLNPIFIKTLIQEGYFIGDLQEDIKGNRTLALKLGKRPKATRIIRRWTGLPNQQIREALFSEDRDVLLPRIKQALLARLNPWITTGTDQELPTIRAIELARQTGLESEKIIRVLSQYPIPFSINGSTFTATFQTQELPQDKFTLDDCKQYGLSPKKIIRGARYQSRPPGGGSVQKARIEESRIGEFIRKKVIKKTIVEFSTVSPQPKNSLTDKEQTDLKPRVIESLILSQPNGEKILDVYRWFEKMGTDQTNWLTGNPELFAQRLIQLSQGQPVDFLIWNCFGFEHKQEKPGEYPFATLINNLDTAITYYFRTRIAEMIEKLSQIGNPQVIILVPTHEVLSDGLGIWKYAQAREERESLIDDTLKSFQSIIDSIPLPLGTSPIKVMRWDKYLETAQAGSQDTYTIAGINVMQDSSDSEKKRKQIFKDAAGLFRQYGIEVKPNDEVITRQRNYLGMYAGEGVVSVGNRIGNRDIVWVNFEEGNVKKSQIIGAKGDIAIVSPATPGEIAGYYKWKKEVISKRKERKNES